MTPYTPSEAQIEAALDAYFKSSGLNWHTAPYPALYRIRPQRSERR